MNSAWDGLYNKPTLTVQSTPCPTLFSTNPTLTVQSTPCPTPSSTNPTLTVQSTPCPTLFSTNPTLTVQSTPCPTLFSTNPTLTVQSTPCPTLFSTNPTPTVLGLDPGLRSDRLLPQRFNHGWPSIMETRCVSCAEETEISNTIPMNLILQRIN